MAKRASLRRIFSNFPWLWAIRQDWKPDHPRVMAWSDTPSLDNLIAAVEKTRVGQQELWIVTQKESGEDVENGWDWRVDKVFLTQKALDTRAWVRQILQRSDARPITHIAHLYRHEDDQALSYDEDSVVTHLWVFKVPDGVRDFNSLLEPLDRKIWQDFSRHATTMERPSV